MKVLVVVAAVALMVAVCGNAAQATSLVINDPSFEDPIGPPTPVPVLNPPGGNQPDWVMPGNNGQWTQVNGWDYAVAWRPTAGNFATGVSIPDGSQVLASVDGTTGVGFGGDVAITQDLSVRNPILGTLQAHTTYTATIAVGKVLGQSFAGAFVGFADATNGDEIGISAMDSWTAADGTFADLSCSFKSDDILGMIHGPYKAGDKLTLLIDVGGLGTVADNVRVDAAVPEPSTLVLLAAGMISMLAYAWRKRKRTA
jgi:hypothetical protein